MLVNINNSFSIFADDNICIWMDPWLGSANYGSWAALYEVSQFEDFLRDCTYPLPDIVYISHLHTDHYDVEFLNFLKQHCDLRILIKDFRDGRLKKRIIEEVNPKEIICINEYEYNEIQNTKFMIVPQISASSAEEENQLEYDLDTSLIIETEDAIIFNEVDNPLHVDDYIHNVVPNSGWNNVKNKTKIGLIGYSGASDYPQSYLGIDRLMERQKVIDKTINRFWQVAGLLNLDFVVPAGGTFILDRGLSAINDFIPVPSQDEIAAHSNEKINLLSPTSELLKSYGDAWLIENRTDKLKRLPVVNRNEVFFTHKKYSDNVKSELLSLKESIEKSMPNRLADIFKCMKTQIKFALHENDPEFDKLDRGEQTPVDEFMVFSSFNNNKTIDLTIHLHWEMLLKMLTGKLIWNELTFHSVYDRRPNVYEPDAMFALNLYKKLK